MTVIDDSLKQPNGIAASPDGKNIYISDTGAITGDITPSGPTGSPWNQTGTRTIYKYDLVDNGTHITGKRPIWLAQHLVPDGLKVAANGYVLTGAGFGVDILDSYGVLIARVQTNYTVQNFAWVGEGLDELWVMGYGGVSRVRWGLKGQDLAAV